MQVFVFVLSFRVERGVVNPLKWTADLFRQNIHHHPHSDICLINSLHDIDSTESVRQHGIYLPKKNHLI